MSKRTAAGLLTGLLAGGIAATGATALAGGGSGAPESALAAPLTCTPPEDMGGSVTFGLLHPRAQ